MIELICNLEGIARATEVIEQIEEYSQENEISTWIIIREKPETPYLITGYFDSEKEALESWKKLREQFNELPEIVKLSKIDEQDWQNAYKQYLKPWSIEDLHWIPLWEKGKEEVPSGHIGIYLDAGMAFGTGAHETTRLCAQRLVEYRNSHKNFEVAAVIDAGCGSGILAISAKRMGFGVIEAFDIDAQAVEVAIENAEANKCYECIHFFAADLKKGLEGKVADVVIANIQADILMKDARVLVQAVKKQGCLILSGILDKECELVKSEFEREFNVQGIKKECSSNKMGEWRDLYFS